MMLSPKEKLILRYLYQERNNYVTSKELATHLACSDRTVRTYIKSLLENLETLSDVKIISKQGSGYQLQVLEEATYLTLVTDKPLHIGSENRDINDRHNYILNKLVFEQGKLFFDDLMDQLYVSRSTLSADFKKIRQELAQYGLTVESKPNEGVYLQGSEQDKRRFIMNYFFSGRFLQNIHKYIGDDFFKLPISFEELTLIVLDECRNQCFKLSDFVIQNLIVHIALALKRINDGFEISEIAIDQKKYHKEIKAATTIVERIRKVVGIAFPKEEINYIALHLISEIGDRSFPDEEVAHVSLRQDLLRATLAIDEHYGYQFNKDFAFIEGLLNHLEILLERMRYDVHLDNPLLEDIENQYKEAFLIARSLVAHLDYFKNHQLSDGELAYISLHILAAIERYRQAKKFNVLVICATGYGSAQMLRIRLENELGYQINIVDLVGYYDISDEKLKGIDFIISTIDLSNLVFSVPVFTVSVFLKEEEVKFIKENLLKMESRSRPTLQSPSHQSSLTTSFDDYFSEAYFKIYERSTKDAVLTDLVQLFYGDDTVATQSMLELIRQREQMSTVVFDETIAVPHPIKALDKTHRIGLAIIKEGLAWDEQFGRIQLVFLVSPSISGNDGLSDLTKRIVDLTDLPDIKEKMVACQTFTVFRKLFLADE